VNRDTAVNAVDQAAALAAECSYADAEQILRAAMARLGTSGSESLEDASAAHQLAGILSATGRPSEAMTLYETALRIRRRLLEPGHPAVAATLHNLAVVCAGAGYSDRARSVWAEARAVIDVTDGASPEPQIIDLEPNRYSEQQVDWDSQKT